MRLKKVCILPLCLMALLVISAPAFAQQDSDPAARENDEIEHQFYQQLEVLNPAAVPIFQEATQAMDSEQYLQAQALFSSVLKLAPDFPPALRRLSYVESKLNNHLLAIKFAQRALEIGASAYDRTALAAALLATEDPTNYAAALDYAKQAVSEAPNSGYGNIVLLEAAIQAMDNEGVRIASSNLIEISPEVPLPHYFAGIAAAENGEWELAENELLKAQELGMEAEQVQKALVELDITNQAQRARQARTLRWVAYGLVGLAGLVALIFLGRGLLNRGARA